MRRPGHVPLSVGLLASSAPPAQREALLGAHQRDVRSRDDRSKHVELRLRMKDQPQADSNDQHGQRQTACGHPHLPVIPRLPSTEAAAHNANRDQSSPRGRHDRTVSMESGAEQSCRRASRRIRNGQIDLRRAQTLWTLLRSQKPTIQIGIMVGQADGSQMRVSCNHLYDTQKTPTSRPPAQTMHRAIPAAVAPVRSSRSSRDG